MQKGVTLQVISREISIVATDTESAIGCFFFPVLVLYRVMALFDKLEIKAKKKKKLNYKYDVVQLKSGPKRIHHW